MKAKATENERVAVLARTFGVTRTELRRALLEAGIVQLELLALRLLTEEQQRRAALRRSDH